MRRQTKKQQDHSEKLIEGYKLLAGEPKREPSTLQSWSDIIMNSSEGEKPKRPYAVVQIELFPPDGDRDYDKLEEELEKMRDYFKLSAESCLQPGWLFKIKD